MCPQRLCRFIEVLYQYLSIRLAAWYVLHNRYFIIFYVTQTQFMWSFGKYETQFVYRPIGFLFSGCSSCPAFFTLSNGSDVIYVYTKPWVDWFGSTAHSLLRYRIVFLFEKFGFLLVIDCDACSRYTIDRYNNKYVHDDITHMAYILRINFNTIAPYTFSANIFSLYIDYKS